MVTSYLVQRVKNSNPSLRDIDRIVPLSLEFLKRHLARSEVLPYLTETYRTHESSLLLFFCFVHLNHNLMNFRCKDKNFPRNFQIKPQKLVKNYTGGQERCVKLHNSPDPMCILTIILFLFALCCSFNFLQFLIADDLLAKVTL